MIIQLDHVCSIHASGLCASCTILSPSRPSCQPPLDQVLPQHRLHWPQGHWAQASLGSMPATNWPQHPLEIASLGCLIGGQPVRRLLPDQHAADPCHQPSRQLLSDLPCMCAGLVPGLSPDWFRTAFRTNTSFPDCFSDRTDPELVSVLVPGLLPGLVLGQVPDWLPMPLANLGAASASVTRFKAVLELSPPPPPPPQAVKAPCAPHIVAEALA